MVAGLFNYFTDETRAVPKGRATVLYAVANRSGRSVATGFTMTYHLDEPSEYSFRTEDGKFFDVIVEGEHIRDEWIAALPSPPTHTMAGWIFERYAAIAGYAAGKRPRYAVFDLGSSRFATYLSEESALLDDCEPQFVCSVKCARMHRPSLSPSPLRLLTPHTAACSPHRPCPSPSLPHTRALLALPPARPSRVAGTRCPGRKRSP